MDNKSFRQKCLNGLARNSSAKCLIVGEVSQSHDGSLGMAHAFVDAIADAGADAVKFQTHIAAEESTPGEPWRVKFSRQDETRYDYWRRMEFKREHWEGLKRHCDDRGVLFLSTPFSELAADWLRGAGMQVWKAASGEIGNLPLLDKMAANGDPIMLSSGMSGFDELDVAAARIKKNGNPLALLQCTTAYPCPPEKVGLNVMEVMRSRYDVPVGLSDHSGKIFAGLAAASLGAEVIEVHVALSREMFGPDVVASITTGELQMLTTGVRDIEAMISSPVDKDAVAGEFSELRRMFTKSIVAGEFLGAGTILKREHLKLKKPGHGLPASEMETVIGRRLTANVEPDDFILSQHLD